MKVTYTGLNPDQPNTFIIEAGQGGTIEVPDCPLIRSCIHLLKKDATNISDTVNEEHGWSQQFDHPLDHAVSVGM
jgi:hypothetical protein